MKRFLSMPPQITRLVLLTIAIICAYFTARYLLTPQSFGQYGHYRGAALQEIAGREPFWAGRKTCDTCHGEIVGPAKAHVDNPEVKLPKPGYGQCVRCHEASPSRPAWIHQVTPAKHYTGQVCTECHVPHQPNEVP